jgi:uncharacterized protein YggT (Ycf19 family)
MPLMDFILNVAGLLLWFTWRAAGFGSVAKLTPATPAGGHRRAKSSRLLRWLSLLALFALVCGRAFFYRLLGPAVDWTASLNLGAVTLFFRTDDFWLTLFFSCLSFARVLVLAYFWLLALCVINRNAKDAHMVSDLICRQLSRVAAWPVSVQLVLPLVFVAAIWPGLHALLTYASITNEIPSFGRLMLQVWLIGLGIYFSLKFLIPALLFADLIAGYIYFGSGPFWVFLSTTARNLLAPLQRLPLRIGKVDFAPLVGIGLTLLLLHALPLLVLQELNKRNLMLWPQ